MIVLGHVYSSELLGRSLVAPLTAWPRRWESTESLTGIPTRVGWWRPGRGERHPAILLVIGATPIGIDFPQLVVAAEGFARAGFLVMLPDLACMKEERFDPTGPRQIADAFAVLRAHPNAQGRPAGAFGFSVGGGVLLAAAGRFPELDRAAYLATLGAYFDMTPYLAGVASRSQRRGGAVVPWEPSPDVPGRITSSLARLAVDGDERRAVDAVLAAGSYDEALLRLSRLPARLREILDGISPRPVWDRVRAPVYWMHDELDRYVPVAEAESARAASRRGRLTMIVPRLLEHSVPVSEAARHEGPRFWVRELRMLLRFAFALMRTATGPLATPRRPPRRSARA